MPCLAHKVIISFHSTSRNHCLSLLYHSNSGAFYFYSYIPFFYTMGPSIPSLASLAGLLAVLPGAIAGYNPGARDGVAVFWGKFVKPNPKEMTEAKTNWSCRTELRRSGKQPAASRYILRK